MDVARVRKKPCALPQRPWPPISFRARAASRSLHRARLLPRCTPPWLSWKRARFKPSLDSTPSGEQCRHSADSIWAKIRMSPTIWMRAAPEHSCSHGLRKSRLTSRVSQNPRWSRRMPFFLQLPRGSARRCRFIIWAATLRLEAINVSTAVSHLAQPSADKERALPETLPLVRVLVRDILSSSPSYRILNPDQRHQLAASMVHVCETGASLLREEHENRSRALEQAVAGERSQATPSPGPVPRSSSRTWSFAQNAGSDFSGVSAQKVAGTTQA